MLLDGRPKSTIIAYTRSVRDLMEDIGKIPLEITDEEAISHLNKYRDEHDLGSSTVNSRICGRLQQLLGHSEIGSTLLYLRQASVRRPQAGDRVPGPLHAQDGDLEPPAAGGDGHGRAVLLQRLPFGGQKEGDDA